MFLYEAISSQCQLFLYAQHYNDPVFGYPRANSADPNETVPSRSDQGLNCLQFILYLYDSFCHCKISVGITSRIENFVVSENLGTFHFIFFHISELSTPCSFELPSRVTAPSLSI